MCVRQHVARKLTSSRRTRTLPPLFSRNFLFIPNGSELEADNTSQVPPSLFPDNVLPSLPSNSVTPASIPEVLSKRQQKKLRNAFLAEKQKEQLALLTASQESGPSQPLVSNDDSPLPVSPGSSVADSAEWTTERWEKENWGSDSKYPSISHSISFPCLT